MGQRWFLNTDTNVENFNAHVTQARLAGTPVTVEFVDAKRSLSQNDMIYALYAQIAEQKPDESITDIRRECKLNYGVPILRAADPVFNGFCAKALSPLTYEQQLKSMDFVEITSRMKKAQSTDFISTIIREYSQQGYCLTHPSEEV